MRVVSFFTTPAGVIEVTHDAHYIYSASFSDRMGPTNDAPLTALIKNELAAYNTNPQHHFQLPLKPQGSVYQLKVWNALLVIPAGRTITYGELAQSLQSSPRAIGQACKRNPLVLFIPCHRVVGMHSIGGYMGNPEALQYKKALLEHERND